ncbi:6229_t:CDS:10, partial [Racocetra fulgida]
MQIRGLPEAEESFEQYENALNNDGFSVISSAGQSTISSRSSSPSPPIHLNDSQSTNDLLQQELSSINFQYTESDDSQNTDDAHSSSTQDDQPPIPNNFDDMTKILFEIDRSQKDEVQSPNTNATDQSPKTTEKCSKENDDYKKHIRAAIEGHKYFNKDPTIKINYGKDLAEYIPGLYRLLDLCKDDGSNGLVEIFIRITFYSFDLLTMSRSSGVKREVENQPTLRSGIYLLMVNPDVGLVIHWPEVGCYEENASSQKKKNMTNLHRYLTKLTDQQICFMSEKDLENFNWGVENDEQDSDDEENNMCYEFEVKKSQEEQEDFKLHPGFQVYLIVVTTLLDSHSIINHNIFGHLCIQINLPATVKKNLEYNDSSLTPMELQSRMQGYSLEIDRKMSMKALGFLIKDGLDQEKELLGPLNDAITLAKKDNDLKKEMEKNSIKTDAGYVTAMSREKIKELYNKFELRFIKTSMETPNAQIDDSGTKIFCHLQTVLYDYSLCILFNYIAIKRINTKYPDMQKKIADVAKINSLSWKKLKQRYLFARLITARAYAATNTDENKEEIGHSTLKLLYAIFLDDEKDMHVVVKKHTEAQKGLLSFITSSLTSFFSSNSTSKNEPRNNQKNESKSVSSHINDTIKQAEEYANRYDDSTFIHDLHTGSFFNSNEEIRRGIIDAFFREYSKWRTDTFAPDVKGILPKLSGPLGKEIDRKLDEEFTLLKRDLEMREFEKICQKIEEKYSTESTRYVCRVQMGAANGNYTSGFKINPYDRVETTQPDQLQITIYETSLEQTDTFELQENELYVPKPRLFTNHYGTTGLHVYAFDEGYTNLFPRNSNVPILQWYNFSAPNMQHFFFIKDTEELCFVEVGGRARIYNLVNGQFRPGIGQIPANATNVVSTPDGACIVAFVKETLQSLEYNQFSLVHKRQIHITTLDLENGIFCSTIAKVTLEKTQYRFQQRSQKRSLGQVRLSSTSRSKNFSIVEGKNTNFTKDVHEGENLVLLGERYNVLEVLSDTTLKISKSFQPTNNEWMEFRVEPKTNLNGLIDSYRLMFEKYPVDSCIDTEKNHPLSLQIALDTQDDDKVEDYQDKFEDYVSEMFEELKRSTKKPATSLKKFTVTVTTFNGLDIVDSEFQQENTTEYQLGEDGLSSEVEQADLEDGYARHVDAIAQNISFGWYEGIFKHFGNRQVKVVSSMGEQMITKQYLYVALDFEGLKSLERTPQEGIDMSTMFQRFQDGATLFESDPKIFQDVPKQDRDDIVREFSLKFNTLVAEEGEDNFITRMYPSGLNITPWPMFNDPAWFKSLKDLKKLLDKQKPKYENARIFLQNTKVIMAKLKICDWGSLDENLVQIRVATLKRLLPTVISLGVEQKDQAIEHLLNRDTGLCIDDPTIPISDIFEDFDNSASLLPDAEILLFEENRDFVQLSSDLRVYFEENVQQRKEAPNDSVWSSRLGKFFKYIIERRVLRVQEWFTQNTAKFPQDNSDVVIGRYAVEQEMNKLTLLWTLCGLTCNDCNLKCLKNRDHKEGHDCLTDHECHATCQFTEAHANKNLIPQCSHKAGHEGKHACSRISHLCGKPCCFSDKRNCQKRCSKEIGHEEEDENHLCQSP